MRDVVLIPTYNECENIEPLVRQIFSLLPNLFVTVIDDNSPDGTAAVVEKMQAEYSNLNLLNRPYKNGLGNAYKEAMLKLLNDESIRSIITMDADGSHPVATLKKFIEQADNYQLIVGSRYVAGGGVSNWNWRRRLLSAGGNFYDRLVTGLPLHDLSAGFTCIRRTALAKINLADVAAAGYSFLVELKYKLIREAGAKSLEVPIVFTERVSGESKLSGSIIREGLLTPWRLRFSHSLDGQLSEQKLMNDQKNILICTGIYPPDIGGPATYVSLLQRELPAHDWAVKIITYGDAGEPTPNLTRISRRQSVLARYYNFFREVYQQLRAADLAYVQGPVSEGLPAALACLLRRKKYVLKIVGDFAWEQGVSRYGVKENLDDFQKRRYGWKVELWGQIEYFVARRACQVVTPSYYLKGIIAGWGIDQEKIEVIYNAVLKKHFNVNRGELRQQLGLTGYTLISVGRLVPWKGFTTLLDVVQELRNKYSDLHLVIIGEGPQKEYLEQLITEHRLQDCVKLAGLLENQEVAKYLAAADLLVLNTSYEGLSHILIEAMLADLPIVTTRVGGNTELIAKYNRGVLVDYNDSKQLQAAIIKMRQEVPKSTADQSLENIFSLDQMIGRIAELLNNCRLRQKSFFAGWLGLEKLLLLVLLGSFFIGITYGFPSSVAVMDEMYFVGGVMRALQHHTMLPQGFDVPYGTLNYFFSFIFIGGWLALLMPFFGFHFQNLQIWVYQHSYLFYLAPRLVSILAASGLLYLIYRLLRRSWPERSLRLCLIWLLFTNLLISSLVHTGKVWLLSTALMFASFYFLYLALHGRRRQALWAIIFSALAIANFPLAGLSLLAWPILFYFAPTINLSRRRLINYCFGGLALLAVVLLFNFAGIRAQVLSIVTDYTLSHDAQIHNLSLLGSLVSYLIKALLVFAPLVLAGSLLHAGIRDKKLFYLSLTYLIVYFLAIVVVARWTGGIYSYLRYLCPLGFFAMAFIASIRPTKNHFRLGAFYFLVAVNLVYFAFFTGQLIRPTTYILARNWLQANTNSQNILIVNRVGAELDLPLNQASAIALQDKFCGSRCLYARQSKQDLGFASLTISEESQATTSRPSEVYYVFSQPQMAGDLRLVKAITNPQHYGIEHSLDTSGDYFDPTFFAVTNLGKNIYIYRLVSTSSLPYLPLPL